MLMKLEKVLKALADKNRIRILKMLEFKPLCVCELTAVLRLSQPSISKHLKILKEAELIEDLQDGLWTDYRLSPQNVYAEKFITQLRWWLEDDGLIIKDLSAARKANRQKLCHGRNVDKR